MWLCFVFTILIFEVLSVCLGLYDFSAMVCMILSALVSMTLFVLVCMIRLKYMQVTFSIFAPNTIYRYKCILIYLVTTDLFVYYSDDVLYTFIMVWSFYQKSNSKYASSIHPLCTQYRNNGSLGPQNLFGTLEFMSAKHIDWYATSYDWRKNESFNGF